MSRTTKVRIPVRVARVSYIVADVELPPEPDEVRGHVAAEPEAVDGEVLP